MLLCFSRMRKLEKTVSLFHAQARFLERIQEAHKAGESCRNGEWRLQTGTYLRCSMENYMSAPFFENQAKPKQIHLSLYYMERPSCGSLKFGPGLIHVKPSHEAIICSLASIRVSHVGRIATHINTTGFR